ncbi:hypothetical protein EDD93_4763 [Streptomyces sp. 840.1]|uniref:DUF6624 domain-containing protein n=1 Tax=Streptomyces sp. 840.1 TaxID=2485152 RepID=UPI000F4A5175|nr:DUF6624 domain-containing protein [Streptomyces sp. 840.1]ROQ70250.1 hypothetical protein EDD93_4763 [Streptomyces sp. 840.1]
MTAAEPQLPDLTRELIDRATKAAMRRAGRVRNHLDAVRLGQGRHADHADTKVLRRILTEHGWPGHRLVGPEGAHAAWSLALHADDEPDFQRAATTLLQRAVQAHDARIQHWAHLYDRTLINSGRRQEHGTQLLLNPEGVTLCPLRAPESLDERRATVGLTSIAAALERARRRNAPDHLAEDAPTVVLAGAA